MKLQCESGNKACAVYPYLYLLGIFENINIFVNLDLLKLYLKKNHKPKLHNLKPIQWKKAWSSGHTFAFYIIDGTK